MTQDELTHSHFIEGLDSDLPFDKLLPATDRERLVDYAARMLGGDVRLLSVEGERLAGRFDGEAGGRRPLALDFEPVAFVECAEPSDAFDAVCELLEWWLGKQHKYLLASTMHHAVVESDYRELQQRNRELEVSEARYRELAEQLERRVQAQVKTIKSAERQLYQQEKLASVGQLAAGMAHEINNPIGFVTSNLRMAGEYVEQLKDYIGKLEAQLEGQLPQEQKEIAYLYQDFGELLQESEDGCGRVTAIVKNLKDFSNVDGTERARESVNDLIEKVCDLYRSQLPEGVALQLKLSDVPLVTLLVGHMAQVFSNLLLNALEAVRSLDPGDRAGSISFATVREGEQVLIKVADNGCGMDADTQRRSFEPFFTTRVVGQGTGLGLTVCRDIVMAHQGTIGLSSQLGRGTVVTIKLPVDAVE